MKFKEISLRKTIEISGIYSVHYFEFAKDYVFTGESHDFWEMVYVDKGEIIELSGEEEITLGAGEILFHEPCEWHNTRANGSVAPNVLVISFKCKSKAMDAFKGRRMHIDSMQRELLRGILSESRIAFSSRLDNPPIAATIQQPIYAQSCIIIYGTVKTARPVSLLRYVCIEEKR